MYSFILPQTHIHMYACMIIHMHMVPLYEFEYTQLWRNNGVNLFPEQTDT